MFAQPENNSFQSHRKAAHRRASVGRLGKYSPASTLCMYRGLTPIFSANSSWVKPCRVRKDATFFPSRFRWGQDSGLRTGIAESSGKSTKPNTRLYIVLRISVILVCPNLSQWRFVASTQRFIAKQRPKERVQGTLRFCQNMVSLSAMRRNNHQHGCSDG